MTKAKTKRLVYRDSSGQLFRARTAIGIVRIMRKAAWVAPGKQAYMKDVARRITVLDSGRSIIATISPEAFLLSLEKFGWLTKVSG